VSLSIVGIYQKLGQNAIKKGMPTLHIAKEIENDMFDIVLD